MSYITNAPSDLSGYVPYTGATANVDLGTYNFTTTGLGTLGSLVVNTDTLVANVSGYTTRVGIGTATPSDLLEVSYPNIASTFTGAGVLFRNPTAADGTQTFRLSPALILSSQGKGATNQQYQWAEAMTPSSNADNLTLRYYYKFGAGAWTVHPFYLDNATGFIIAGLANGEDPYKAPNVMLFLNTTAATVTVDQYSPSLAWASTGWKTQATAASQYMGLNQVNAPEKGVISPIGVHKWIYGINTYGNSITENEELMRFQWGSDAGVTGVILNEQSLNDYIFRVEGATDANLFKIDAATESVKIGGATTSLVGFYGVVAVNQPDTIADPSGGLVIDTEARTAINTIIDRLQELGLVA